MADLPFVLVTDRRRIALGDGPDVGDNPDVTTAQTSDGFVLGARVRFVPKSREFELAETGEAFYQADVIGHYDTEGVLRRFVEAAEDNSVADFGPASVVLTDLTSSLLARPYADDVVTWTATFEGFLLDGQQISFTGGPIRPVPGEVNLLSRLIQRDGPEGQPIVLGPPGRGLASIAIDEDGEFVATYTDGTTASAGEAPVLDVTSGTTTTLAPGSPATVTPRDTPTGRELDFGIPQGVPGQDGVDGQDGADGLDASDAAQDDAAVAGFLSTDGTQSRQALIEAVGQESVSDDELAQAVAAHADRTDNPHAVTKAQVDLADVPNVDARARSTHTGTQAIATVDGLQSALDAKETPAGAQSKVDAASTEDRKRTNHTGVQPIGSVDGLQGALDAKVPTSRTVAGKALTGNITLVKADVGLDLVDNVSAANLRDRTTHTGSQAISTVTNLQTMLDGKASTADLTKVRDEGVLLTRRDTLNFVGEGVTATDDSANGRTIITVAGASTPTGTGSPEGVRTANPGASFIQTDAAALGGILVWRKLTGTGNTGWAIEQGDTGWRDVSALARGSSTPAANTIKMRRVIGMVLVQMATFPLTSGPLLGGIAPGSIPAGFQSSGYEALTFMAANGGSVTYQVAFNVDGASFMFRSSSSGGSTAVADITGTGSYPTRNAWPSSLPGTATT